MHAGGQGFDSPHLHQDSYPTPPSPLSISVAIGKQSGKQILEDFIADRKATKGLTARGEEWLRKTLTRYLRWLPVTLEEVTRDHIVAFLSSYEDKPWRKHSFYRSLRTFWRWISTTYQAPNPFIDRFGNPVIDAPKVPSKVLYTISPEKVLVLIDAASSIRDKSMISLVLRPHIFD